jgi:hypothetical protein
MMRNLFGPARDAIEGGRRKLFNGELHNLSSSPGIFRVIKSRRILWTEFAGRMGRKRNASRILMGKPEGKKQLRRPRSRWDDNNKISFRGMGLDGKFKRLFTHSRAKAVI